MLARKEISKDCYKYVLAPRKWLQSQIILLTKSSLQKTTLAPQSFCFQELIKFSSNASLCDEFGKYCFINRLLSAKAVYVWGHICLDWHISCISALFVAACSFHLSAALAIWLFRLPTRMEEKNANWNCTSSALCSPPNKMSTAAGPPSLLWQRHLFCAPSRAFNEEL